MESMVMVLCIIVNVYITVLWNLNQYCEHNHILTGYLLVPQYMETEMRSYPMFHDPGYIIPQDIVDAFQPHKPMALP